MAVSPWVYVHHVFVMSMLARRDIGSFNMRVIDRCKLPILDAGIQTLVICKNSKCSQLLTHLSSPSIPFLQALKFILLSSLKRYYYFLLLWEIGWMSTLNPDPIYKVILDIYLLFSYSIFFQRQIIPS